MIDALIVLHARIRLIAGIIAGLHRPPSFPRASASWRLKYPTRRCPRKNPRRCLASSHTHFGHDFGAGVVRLSHTYASVLGDPKRASVRYVKRRPESPPGPFSLVALQRFWSNNPVVRVADESDDGRRVCPSPRRSDRKGASTNRSTRGHPIRPSATCLSDLPPIGKSDHFNRCSRMASVRSGSSAAMGPALIGVICGDMVVAVHGSEATCVTGARRSGQPLSDLFLDVLAQLGVDVLPVLEHAR